MHRQHFGNVKQNFCPPPAHRGQQLEQHYVPQEMNYPARRNTARFLIQTAQEKIEEIDEPLYELPIPEMAEEFADLGNTELPVHKREAEIIDAIQHNQITIIVGPTGSGKTTQAPQMALKAGFERIDSCQPRRLAASETAGRIEEEIVETVGYMGGNGLSRFRTQEKCTVTDQTMIEQCTDGIQLRRSLDADLSDGKSITFIDEIHELNQNLTAIAGLEVERIKNDPNHRVVFMSATPNLEPLVAFIEKETGKKPAIVQVEGRQFEISVEEKSDMDAIDAALWCMNEQHPDEDMLIFVSDTKQIKDTINGIWKGMTNAQRSQYSLERLHAKMTHQEQQYALRPVKNRKIIVATNVAQTSLTIPGVGVVIDMGETRESQVDEDDRQGLYISDATLAECMQRAGRAGRTKQGFYYLVKPSKYHDLVPLADREKFQVPEILRTNFDRLTLLMAGRDKRYKDLPSPVEIPARRYDASERRLMALGALDENGVITTLGKKMDAYPIEPSSARMMVEARNHPPEVRSYVAAIVSALETGGLPYYVEQKGFDWSKITEESVADPLAQLDFFIASQGKSDQELREMDIDVKNVHDARQTYRKVARLAHIFNVDTELRPPAHYQIDAIKSCIYAGMVDNLYQFSLKVGKQSFYTKVGEPVMLRELSNRSFVSSPSQLMFAKPFTIEARKRRGDHELIPMVMEATSIEDPQILGTVMPEKTEWEPAGHVWRNGRMQQVEQRVIAGIALSGATREQPAEPSKEVREAVIQNAMNQPGPAQKELRNIKKQTEVLAHLSKGSVKVLTQRLLEQWVREAAPEDITNPAMIDVNLSAFMEKHNITFRHFVSFSEERKIIENAPRHIQTEDPETGSEILIKLTYRRGVPIAVRFDTTKVLNRDEEIYLPDGRAVHFVMNRKKPRKIKAIKAELKNAKRLGKAGLRVVTT